MAQKTDTHDAHKADRKGGNDTHYEIKAKNATEEDKRFLAEHVLHPGQPRARGRLETVAC